MDYYKVIIKFRRDLIKLDYHHSKLRIWGLKKFAVKWCEEHGLPEEFQSCFFEFAENFEEMQAHLSDILYLLKKYKKQGKEINYISR